jgi:hypothetical protein
VAKEPLPNDGRDLSPRGKVLLVLALASAVFAGLTFVAPAAQRTPQLIPVTTLTTTTLSTFTTGTTLTTLTTTLTTSTTISDQVSVTVKVKGPGSVSGCGTANSIDTPTSADAVTKCTKKLSDGIGSSLTAATIPGDDATFAGWTGGCASPSDLLCNFTAAAGLTLTAVFTDATAPALTADNITPGASPLVTTDADGTFAVPFNAATTKDPTLHDVQCKVDSGIFTACSSPLSIHNPSDGDHTVTIKGTDPSGNTGQADKTLKLYTLPLTTITSPTEGALVNKRPVPVTITRTKGVATCSIDGGAFSACASSYNLPDGPHTLAAKSLDDFSGPRVGPTVTRSFTVDTTPPDTTISDGPTDGLLTNLQATSFGFTSEPGATFQCSIDDGPFGACPGGTPGRASYSTAPGNHAFAVRAVDRAGNADPTPVRRAWSITADLDHDGFVIPADCNDANPAINPGAKDIPDNGIDENCDGKDARGPIPGTLLTFNFSAGKAFTVLSNLVLKHVPKGGTVTVTCKGKKCPTKKSVIKHARQTVKLKAFNNKRLTKGSVLEIRVAKTGMTTLVKRLKIRSGRAPAAVTLCLPKGAKKPGACSA